MYPSLSQRKEVKKGIDKERENPLKEKNMNFYFVFLTFFDRIRANFLIPIVSMAKWDVVIRFDEVTYGYVAPKWLLDEVNFSVREGSKITLMGQNGAGKSTIFKMITGEYKPNEWRILITQGKHIAIAKQVMSHDDKLLTLWAYFRKYSRSDAHNIDRDIKDVLDAVDFMPSIPPGSALTKEQVFARIFSNVR
jgi:ATPase subunit of ABC transporter with duplicated ATPase domains